MQRSPESIRAEKYGIEGAHVRWMAARYGYVLDRGHARLVAERWPSGSIRRSFSAMSGLASSKYIVGRTQWELLKDVKAALAKLEKEKAYIEDFIPQNQGQVRWDRKKSMVPPVARLYSGWTYGEGDVNGKSGY